MIGDDWSRRRGRHGDARIGGGGLARLGQLWEAGPSAGLDDGALLARSPDGPDPITVDLAAPRGVVVRGRVTDKETGRPLAGSLNAGGLAANPRVGEFPGYVRSRRVYRYTDEDGCFEVVVPPGPSLVAFRARDETHYRSPQLLPSVAETLGAEAPRSVAGGPPQSRAVGMQESLTNYHVVAGVDAPPGAEAVPLDLAPDPGRSIELHLRDPEGRPIGGVEVDGSSDFLRRIPRWQDGSTVQLEGFHPGDSRRVTVRHPERKLVGSAVIRTEDGSPQSLILVPWGEVAGRIVPDDGSPRPGVSLADGPQQFPSGHRLESIGLLPRGDFAFGIAADPDARFRVVGLVPGLHYAASAENREGGRIGDLFDDVTVEPGEVRDLGDLKVRLLPQKPRPKRPE